MATKTTNWICSFCSKSYPKKEQALNCEDSCAQHRRFALISSKAEKLFPVAHKQDHIGFVHCVKCGMLLESDDGFRVLRGLRCISCREKLLREMPKLLESPDFRDVVIFLLRIEK